MSIVAPGLLTWDEWSVTILTDYPFATMPYPEKSWREWVRVVVGNKVFGTTAVPDPDGFLHWRDWAESVVGAVG